MSTIANRLRLARIRADLSQGKAAKRLGMHRPTISQIEANKRRITAEELITFSELYGVSVLWLLGLSQETLAIAKTGMVPPWLA